MTVKSGHLHGREKYYNLRSKYPAISSGDQWEEEPPKNSCKNQVSDKNKTTESKQCVERTHTHAHTQSDEGSGCVGQMTSCIGVCLLCCRALLSVAGGGGVVSSFSVCTFFFVSGGSSHGRTSLGLCLVRPTVLSLSLSAGTDTGSSRDVTPRGTNERGAKGAVPGFNRPRLLFMRHTYPRATLRVEQRVCFVWQVPTVTDHSVCMQQR